MRKYLNSYNKRHKMKSEIIILIMLIPMKFFLLLFRLILHSLYESSIMHSLQHNTATENSEMKPCVTQALLFI
jgi:hypothetical protein